MINHNALLLSEIMGNNQTSSSLLRLTAYACAGGLLVLIGLCVEKIYYVRNKKLENLGWGILVLGIMVEIASAGWFTWHSENENKRLATEAEKNNPLNQLVSDVSLQINFELKDTNFVAAPLWGSSAIAWVELCDSRTNLPGGATMSVSDPHNKTPLYSTLGEFSAMEAFEYHRSIVAYPSLVTYSYSLNFQHDAVMNGMNFEVSWPTKVREITENLKVFFINAKFIPNDSEITRGVAILTINGIRMRFQIPSQKAYPPPRGLGTNAGDSGFSFIATNGIVAPQGYWERL